LMKPVSVGSQGWANDCQARRRLEVERFLAD